jgi:GNAT superfamily N-acetyltransferase
MDYVVREFRIGNLQDAELLAAMWNASDAGWPWGWTRGVPETAERILDRTQKIDRLAIFVVEVNGEIVGYGDMERTRGRNDSADLNLLNVRPDFHGKGLGKALVLKILERTIERGYKQLTIGTWGGNMKSVPLYKKTGFFWVPETSVWMQNYIPTALSMPIARDFFAKHDWYKCFQRELEMVPDDIEWNGIKVYPYRFAEGDDHFAMWIDKQAETPTAVETNDLYAACIVSKEEIICGLEQPIRWEIVNKNGSKEPLQVVLMADGEEGIGLNTVENFVVEDRKTIEKSFTVSPEIKPKEEGMPSHQVKSTLLVNGVPVTLGTAVNPMQPVDIWFDSKMVVSGKNEKVVVKLKSNLDFPVQGELIIDPHPSLNFDRLNATFTIEPKSWTSCTFYLQVDEMGAFNTKMRIVCPHDLNPDFIPTGSSLTTKSKTITFVTLPLDSVYVWYNEEDKMVTVESSTMWVQVLLRRGEVYIHERLSGRQIFGYEAPELGPPFLGWEHVPKTYSYRLEQKDGIVSITLIIPSENVPGITVEKTITVGAGSFVRVDHRLINTTGTSQKFKMRCAMNTGLRGSLTMPRKEGIIHEPIEGFGEFPLYDRDLSKKPDDYSESWFAYEDSGLVAGVVWDECEERNGIDLLIDIPEMPPQSYYDVKPIHLVAGRGNWEVVRQLWQWLKQPSTVIEERKPIVHPVLDVGFVPSPLCITRPETNTELIIHNQRGKSLNGKWQIEDCQLIQPADGELADIKQNNPYVQKITIATNDLTPRIETAKITLTEEVTTRKFPTPVIILGDADRSVNFGFESSDDKPSTISVDNGYFSFTVAPTFLGSVTALECKGISYLNTSYPKAIPYLWVNPWFGGIHPFLGWQGNQRFTKEKFTGAQIERAGKYGIMWHGVKVASDIQHKYDRWLRMEIEYLTIGGSNVLAIVHRFINRTNAPQGTRSGVCLWLTPDYENDVLYYIQNRPRYEQASSTNEQERILRHRRHSEYEFETFGKRWAAAENTRTGGVLALIAPHPDTNISVEATGKNVSNILNVDGWVALKPEETKEIVSWLVICNSVSEAQEYQALVEMWELP